MKKKIQKTSIDRELHPILRSYNEEIKRHMGALEEHFEDGVKAIGEQYFDLKKDITDIKETLGSHTETLKSHTQILNSHTETLKSHTEMIGQLMVDLTDVKNNLKQKVSYDDFSRLEIRVSRLEAQPR